MGNVRLIASRQLTPVFRLYESESRAITTVVQELATFGRSRFAAMRISSRWRSPRMIGQ